MRPPIYIPNPLAFPGGAPGFDPSHPAANSCRFSGIAVPPNFLNLLNGNYGVISGAPSAATLGVLGPATNFPSASSTAVNSFSGKSTTNDTRITLAALVQWTSTSNQSVLLSTSSLNSGWRLDVSTSSIISITAGTVGDLNGPTIVANIPYFVAASVNTNVVNFVLLRLDTGALVTSTTAGSSPIAPNGTYQIGNLSAFNLPAKAYVGAAMISASYLSVPALRQWAQRPWDFWYPPSATNLLFSGLKHSALVAKRGYVQGRIIG
jgi:hypothetical protein